MHILTKAVLSAVAGVFLAGNLSANGFDQKYFEVDESAVTIEEIAIDTKQEPVKPGDPPAVTPPGTLPGPQITPPGQQPGMTPGQTVDLIDKIVNLAEKIFGIIEKNQPVVNITTNYANAVPFGMTHWTQLQGWNPPTTRRYKFRIKNLYGMEVVSVTYQLHYTWGGNLQGKGKFLTGVTVEPLNVDVAWGYKVNLTAEVPDSTIANVGTSEDPIAAMQVQLKWNVHTVVKDSTSKAIYYVQGDGLMQPLGDPFKNAIDAKARESIERAELMLSVPF